VESRHASPEEPALRLPNGDATICSPARQCRDEDYLK
jgi:hypothetical protein